MSDALQPLIPAAMVGTERMPAPRLALPGEVGALLDSLQAQPGDDAASHLLRMAGVIAVCARAGANGRAAGDLPAPAAEESRPALDSPPALSTLAWALREGPTRLQHEALAAVANAGWRLPPALLPLALELGRRNTAVRAALEHVLGERGRWLGLHNAAWRFAQGAEAVADTDTRWAEGSLEQRVELLRGERAIDPVAARARLEASLPELPARERAELVAALAVGVSKADEPLLDRLRQDRARDVRQAALALLLRLPDTAQGARAAARIAPCLRQERVLLVKRWVIEAPTEAQADWKADDIDLTRPKHESLGDRGWWLYQLARQTPLAWWTTHTGMSPAELIEWAQRGDWPAALLRAWREVLLAAPDLAWAEALLKQWPAKHLQDPASVMALLPLHRREAFWLQRLDGKAGAVALAELSQELLSACPPGDHLTNALSQRLAAALAHTLPTMAGMLQAEYTLRQTVPDLVCMLHPESLGAMRALAPVAVAAADTSPSLANLMHGVARIVAARDVLATLPQAPRRTPA